MPIKTYSKDDVMKTLDFKVEKKKLFTEDNIQVDKIALVRADTKKCLGVVSDKYSAVDHKGCFEAAYDGMKRQFGNKGFKITQFEMPKDGARTYITMDVDNGIDVLPKDTVLPRLIMTNSFDGTLKFGFILGAFRVVCSNGLRAGMGMLSVNMRHMGINMNDLTFILNRATNQFGQEAIPTWQQMSKTTLDVDGFMMNLRDATNVPSRMIEYISEKVPKKANAWELYNAFTHHLTHEYDRSYERALDINGQIIEQFQKAMV